jgi:hypothetical protein
MVNTVAMPFNKGSFVGQLDGRAAPAQANDMTGNQLPSTSRFELAARELHTLGITLTRLAGEYVSITATAMKRANCNGPTLGVWRFLPCPSRSACYV